MMSFGLLSYHETRPHATHSPIFARITAWPSSESKAPDSRICLAGSKKLNHKDLWEFQELAISRRYAPSVPLQGRSASRSNIFAPVAWESAINDVLFMCKPDSLSRATRAKMLAGGRSCGSGKATLVLGFINTLTYFSGRGRTRILVAPSAFIRVLRIRHCINGIVYSVQCEDFKGFSSRSSRSSWLDSHPELNNRRISLLLLAGDV
jgi:hypothetical protein